MAFSEIVRVYFIMATKFAFTIPSLFNSFAPSLFKWPHTEIRSIKFYYEIEKNYVRSKSFILLALSITFLLMSISTIRGTKNFYCSNVNRLRTAVAQTIATRSNLLNGKNERMRMIKKNSTQILALYGINIGKVLNSWRFDLKSQLYKIYAEKRFFFYMRNFIVLKPNEIEGKKKRKKKPIQSAALNRTHATISHNKFSLWLSSSCTMIEWTEQTIHQIK